MLKTTNRKALMVKKRKFKKQSNAPGYGLIISAAVIVFLGLSVVAWFMFFLNQPSTTSLETNCRLNGPVDTTLIFVDDTTPLTQTQTIRIANIIRAHSEVRAEAHQISLTSVKNSLSNRIDTFGCLPRDWNSLDDHEKLIQNRENIERRIATFFQDIEYWSANTVSEGSYADYLSDWAQQFVEAGVAVTTTDTEVQIVLSDAVTFDTGSDVLNADGSRIIENLAMILSEKDQFSINIVGHTDNVGDAERNQVLSERRAASVANMIIGRGVRAEDVNITGRGDSAPLVPNTDDATRRLNRRVEITLAPKRLLIEALDRALALLESIRDPNGLVDIVMISDMAQSSPLFSVYTGQTWTDFIASPEGATLNLSAEDVSISLYRILRPDTVSSKLAILDFWRNYFNAKSIHIATDQEI